ncbi:hypothetical protein D3C72_472710 [compost metagenome]
MITMIASGFWAFTSGIQRLADAMMSWKSCLPSTWRRSHTATPGVVKPSTAILAPPTSFTM